MPRCSIPDGYTLESVTLATLLGDRGEVVASSLPTLAFKYRPALPDAIYSWRYDLNRAGSGRAELDATAKFLADHLVSWDRSDNNDLPVPLSAATIRTLPEQVLNQVLKAVITWAPKAAESAVNLPTG